MNIGDTVQWVPSIDHQFDPRGQDGFSWEHELYDGPKDKWFVGSHALVLNAIEIIKRDSRRRKELRATRPMCTYPAKVTDVSEDGKSVSLDITSPVGGVTLHYVNVAIDPTGKPGTCH